MNLFAVTHMKYISIKFTLDVITCDKLAETNTFYKNRLWKILFDRKHKLKFSPDIRANRPKICENCSFMENFLTKKLCEKPCILLGGSSK